MTNKKSQSNIRIPKEELDKRTVSVIPVSHSDYLDTGGYRRIFPDGGTIKFENKIFNETVGICLKEEKLSIEIINCEFKKGLFIRRGEIDVDYSIFIFKSEINDALVLHSFDAKNKISIDTSTVSTITVSGKSEKIDFFNSQVDTLVFEFLKCDRFNSERSDLIKFSLYKFTALEVDFDTDNIAISDYSRFIERSDQSKKQTSEIYHRFALKAVKTIKASRAVNYQLTKSTMNWVGIFFGYFYKPIHIILWILCIVIVYGVLYWLLFDKELIVSIYFSSYTFLTIGYGEIESSSGVLKTILVFSEGLLGITYAAALLTSIINFTKK
jgi:hypothetical protein